MVIKLYLYLYYIISRFYFYVVIAVTTVYHVVLFSVYLKTEKIHLFLLGLWSVAILQCIHVKL